METIAQDNLKEIFHFLGVFYFPLLKCVNKEWKQIIEKMEIENTNIQKNQKYFYFLVNDFVSREDFETLNIQFTFQNKGLFANFSSFGLLNSIKYLHEKNPTKKKIKIKDNQEIEWDEWSCANAAWKGHLHILKYLHENNCQWNKSSCANASFYGHLNILKYLHENNCPWERICCANAAWKGHLEILKYLHENNCPWDEWCCRYASFYGHLHILKYLRENNCPFDKQDCLNYTRENEIREYIEKFM